MLGWIGFMSGEPHLLAFSIIVMTGLACGSVPTGSAFPPSVIGSLFTTVLPVTIFCLQAGGGVYNAYLFLIVCLVAINLQHCRVTYRDLWETIRLRFENSALVDELRSERDRASAADQAKTRFLAAASHDLRQPVHALGLFNSTLAALASRETVAASAARQISDNIKRVVGSLSDLLNALLDVSRLDAQLVVPNRQAVSINRIFEEVQHEFASEAVEKELHLRIVPTSLSCDSDPTLLKQILANLLSNAIKYTDRGRILVGCRHRGREIEIQVLDTGIGIPQEKHALIFEEFVQLDNFERNRDKGLGLGLSIIKRTAALLRHPIRLVSRFGKGSLFSVTVPRAEKVGEHTTSPTAQGGIRNIIVIDDEPAVLDALCGLLSVLGHRVHAGSTAAAAYRSYQTSEVAGEPDLLIVDYRLQGQTTGTEAAGEIFALLKRALPVIILTGDTSPERLREASASGYLLLHKPIDPERLVAAISERVRG
ncbi:hybrid sensor histidine kinase/response regulator [Brucella oryzae]|nr:hybrid sensor histidine kinase/response regulator [Brucella oryzae]